MSTPDLYYKIVTILIWIINITINITILIIVIIIIWIVTSPNGNASTSGDTELKRNSPFHKGLM